LQQVKQLAKLFREIAMEKTTKARQGQVQNNGIQRTITPAAAPSPRVDKELSPMVEEAQPPRVEKEPRMIVACTKEAGCYVEPGHGLALISQEIEEPQEIQAPARRTSSRMAMGRTITQEAMLSCIEMSDAKVTPRSLVQRKFPLKLLCEMAGAIMDANGEMLEYRHLIKRPEYRDIWSKSYGNEIDRLAQGMQGRVEGTNTMFFIDKRAFPKRGSKTSHMGALCVTTKKARMNPTEQG